jgi:phage terminase large subunit-like protein
MEADRVCAFAELMPHIKGEWARRKERIKLEDWQCFILCSLFGWKQRNGQRRYRTAYIEVARKNAKSTLAAVIALICFAADGEAGAEVYSVATKKDQAKIVWSAAAEMARREPEFREHFGVDVRAHNLNILDSASKFEALSSDDDSLDGLNVHCAIVDELHAHKTRGVWDVLETATGARSQPLIIAITTAGSNQAGICYEQRAYVCKLMNDVLHRHDGLGYRIEGDTAVDESYFGLIYTIDDGDDWTSEVAWKKANPNYGVSVSADDLRRKCAKALQMASAQPNFLTKHLDVWVNADSAWMDMRAWEAASDRTMKREDFADWEWVIGLDLASKVDIAAKADIAFKGREYRLFGQFYLPEAAIEEGANSQYKGWERAGHIIEAGEIETDYQRIEDDVDATMSAANVVQVAYDPGFGWDFSARLEKRGLPMLAVRASAMEYSEPMKELEAAVISGRLKHDGNPAMSWMVSNVVCHRDAKDNIYPRKEREENKIDGVVAAISALNLIMRRSRGDSLADFYRDGLTVV